MKNCWKVRFIGPVNSARDSLMCKKCQKSRFNSVWTILNSAWTVHLSPKVETRAGKKRRRRAKRRMQTQVHSDPNAHLLYILSYVPKTWFYCFTILSNEACTKCVTSACNKIFPFSSTLSLNYSFHSLRVYAFHLLGFHMSTRSASSTTLSQQIIVG